MKKLLQDFMDIKDNAKKFIRSDRGASLVLIAAFSTIVIAMAVTLTVVSAMIFANAENRSRQDQVQILATGLFSEVEKLILNPPSEGTNKACIDLESYFTDSTPAGESVTILQDSGFESMPDSSVEVSVKRSTDKVGNTIYTLTVKADAIGETYIKTEDYSGNVLAGYSRM